MVDSAPDEAEPKLPSALSTIGVVILAAAPQLDVQKDRMVAVSAASKAFLLNLMDAYSNCGHPLLDDWKFPPGDTWEVTPELAGEIADHAPSRAVLVSLARSVHWPGRHDVWWSRDAEWLLAKHLMRRQVAVSVVAVRTGTKAEVTLYRDGRQFPGARMIDLAPCLRQRSA
jgi:hypothetical protein